MIAKFSVPCYLKIGKKNAINLNTFRNLHYQANNQAKKKFKKIVDDDLEKLPLFLEPIHIRFKYFLSSKREVDIPNIHSILDKFLLDAIVSAGKLEDDNFKFYPSFDGSFGDIDKENPRAEIEIGYAKNININWS